MAEGLIMFGAALAVATLVCIVADLLSSGARLLFGTEPDDDEVER